MTWNELKVNNTNASAFWSIYRNIWKSFKVLINSQFPPIYGNLWSRFVPDFFSFCHFLIKTCKQYQKVSNKMKPYSKLQHSCKKQFLSVSYDYGYSHSLQVSGDFSTDIILLYFDILYIKLLWLFMSYQDIFCIWRIILLWQNYGMITSF